ncbi:MAG: SRPBCC family protein [Nocardioides sp.]|nr:SRPBCC family protein [Nocardioides sp.]
MTFTVVVDVPAPVGDVFDLLSDPGRRPEWQSSLRRVVLLDDQPPRRGTRWYDVTVAGVRPLMEITQWQEDRLWAERGTWRGISVELVLHFEARGEEARVTADATTLAGGLLRPVGGLLDLFGPRTARRELDRAAAIVARI